MTALHAEKFPEKTFKLNETQTEILEGLLKGLVESVFDAFESEEDHSKALNYLFATIDTDKPKHIFDQKVNKIREVTSNSDNSDRTIAAGLCHSLTTLRGLYFSDKEVIQSLRLDKLVAYEGEEEKNKLFEAWKVEIKEITSSIIKKKSEEILENNPQLAESLCQKSEGRSK